MLKAADGAARSLFRIFKSVDLLSLIVTDQRTTHNSPSEMTKHSKQTRLLEMGIILKCPVSTVILLAPEPLYTSPSLYPSFFILLSPDRKSVV